MLRRNARLRREYLYRKSLEGKDREEYERKLKIRRALEGHAPAKVISNDHQSLASMPARREPLLRETTEQVLTLVHCTEQRASPSQQSCARRSEH